MGRLAAFSCMSLAVALLAGCGGGSSKLTHEQFVSKANAICADYNARTKELGTPSSIASIAPYAVKLRKIAEDDVGRFKKLSPPAADRASWEAYGKLGDKLISATHALETAAKNNDLAALQQQLANSKTRAAETKRIAAAMGTAECAKT